MATATPVNPFAKPGTNIIDGKAVADHIRKEITDKAAELKAKFGQAPGLAVVIVGNRGDSQTYVRMKKKACEEVGIVSFGADLPETATQEEVLKVVSDFNADPRVHGILVQLPLPKHIDEQTILGAVSLEKDVDGFHPLNVGKLTMKGHTPLFVPCTPKGCIELLDRCNIPIKGKNAVVVGRSNIVGMPVAMLLNKRDATVTICHSGTKDMAAVVQQADIVIAACGQANLIKGSWIKPGAAVIDVGTNPVPDSTKKAGFRLVGDVEFSEAVKVAGAITPVPGGVGPMTITMLLSNTVESAKRTFESPRGGKGNKLKQAFDKLREGVTPLVVTGIAVGAAAVGVGISETVRLIVRRARRRNNGSSSGSKSESRKARRQQAVSASAKTASSSRRLD